MATTKAERAKLLHVLSYIAVIAVGIALLLGAAFARWDIGDQGFAGALATIAQVLAYIVVACYSFSYARAKNIWYLIAWVVAVVLIVIAFIL